MHAASVLGGFDASRGLVGAGVSWASRCAPPPRSRSARLPTSYPECTRKPTPQDLEGAKGAHKAATQFYERAEYDKAIRYWNDAYAFDCTANNLLVNIANAYEKLGDLAATVATLEAYLKRTGPNPTIEQKVKNLRALMAAAARRRRPPPDRAAARHRRADGGADRARSARRGPARFGNTPWFLVGGGGALAIVGAILLPVGYGNISSAAR